VSDYLRQQGVDFFRHMPFSPLTEDSAVPAPQRDRHMDRFNRKGNGSAEGPANLNTGHRTETGILE